MDEKITIYIVTFTGGKARISSVEAVEKDKTYKANDKTVRHYFGWQYVGRQIRKDKNVFTGAREAASYALNGLAKFIQEQEEEINDAKEQRVELYQMLNKVKEE